MTSNALIEVLQERIRQDEMWGAALDEAHTSHDWDMFIRCRLDEYYNDETPPKRRREMLIHIAAMALACLQADDREGQAMQT